MIDEHPISLANPPGQPRLHYRVGTYSSFLAAMLGRIRRELPTGAQAPPPLAFLSEEEPENWVVGLLDAWARVGDVLTFYQERIANEGFLGTAQEELSVRELVRALAYAPRRALATSTFLAFRAAAGKDMPEEVHLDAGARVTTLPRKDHPKQTFETADLLALRSAWNEMSLVIPRTLVTQAVRGSTKSLVLSGLRSSLVPGAVLLISGRLESVSGLARPRAKFLRTLEAVEAEPGPPSRARTVVRWRQPLLEQDDETRISQVRVSWLSQRGYLFGGNAPRWEDVALQIRRQYRPILGGIQVSEDGGVHWQARNGDRSSALSPPSPSSSAPADGDQLPARSVNALLATPGGALFAATDVGVYRAVTGGGWHAATTGMKARRVLCMTSDTARDQIFAGTDTGLVFRSVDGAATWEPTSGQSPVTLAAALAQMRSKRPGVVSSPPAAPIRSLAVIDGDKGERFVLAATDSGVFLGTEQGATWKAVNQGLPGLDPRTQLTSVAVYSFAARRSGSGTGSEIFAGTEYGVFRRSGFGPKDRWHAFDEGLVDAGADAPANVQVLSLLGAVLGNDFCLFAGTDQGLYRRALGQTATAWQAVRLTATGPEPKVRALTVRYGLVSLLFAGTDVGLFRSEDGGHQWEHVSLDGSHPPVSALTTSGREILAATPFGGFAIEQWPGFRIEGADIDLSGVSSSIAPGSWIALFEAPTSRVGVYRVVETSTVRRQDFTLSSMVTRVRVETSKGLDDFDLRNTVALFASRDLPLEEVSEPVLRTLPAGTGSLSLPRVPAFPEQRLLVLSGMSTETGRSVTQVTSVLASEQDETGTRVRIDPPTGTELEASSLKIYGNVVRAVQGETVRQTLGSGNARQGGQTFLLGRSLSDLPAPSDPTGTETTLVVEVDGVGWSRVPSLLAAGPRDRVYALHYDLEGRPLVTFGDGRHGARLPTGHHNVRASYLSGFLPQTVAAEELAVLRTRPAGLLGVTNPMPATGGAPPEAIDEIRRRAALSTRTLGRIVTRQDLEDFVTTYPGISRALVSSVKALDAVLLVATLAGHGGEPVPVDGALMRQLARQIEQRSGIGWVLRLRSYQRVGLRVTVRVTARLGGEASDLRARVAQALLGELGARGARFLATIAACHISSTVQRVEGVSTVRVLELCPVPGAPPVQRSGSAPVFELLTALPARWQAGRVEPAQLLILDPADLRVEIEGP